MAAMWLVRGDGGRLYEDFRENGVVAIGWEALAARFRKGMPRSQLKDIYREAEPTTREGAVISGASQVWRFVNEVAIGDRVATYSPANRTYLVGTVQGEPTYHPEWSEVDMSLARLVQWTNEIPRDSLSTAAKNSLGSTLTVFQLPPAVASEFHAVAAGEAAQTVVTGDAAAEETVDPLADVESLAVERIKDLISELNWTDMQDLVAGLLRAMGYKTQVSPAGADRGKDIIASPDGFGFENPRIVVEVKHRRGQMGSEAIRSFLGGRHRDDRGLYVSTGGFSKDAYYEAERAQVPLTLWTLDNLVRALLEHYDATDSETKRIVPLRRMYWPA